MSGVAHEDAAARWVVRQASGNWSDEDESDFNTWLTASTANRVAYLRVKTTWEGATRLKSLQPEPNSETVPPRGSWHLGPAQIAPPVPTSEELPAPATQPLLRIERKRARVWGALAAACVIGTICTYALITGVFSGRLYSTPVGVTETVALHDGSRVILNTNSAIRVDLGPGERHIRLNSGEVYVEVAKDANRPFVVQAGNSRVTAVGTQFSVRREGEGIQVVVTEGTVRMESQSGPSAVGAAIKPLLVDAGEVALLVSGEATIRAEEDGEAERLLSWRNGYVSFENATLSDAVNEFNRYTTRAIVIGDPSIADIRLSGNFRIDNIEGFLELLQDGFNINVQRSATGVTLHAR